MTDDEIRGLRDLAWIPSRIPKRKALVTFVPEEPPCPPALELAMRGTSTRWYPVSGGHRVLILHERATFDSTLFTLEPEGWDHEDCDICGDQIPLMTLCHVTKYGRYFALCERCYQEHAASARIQDA